MKKIFNTLLILLSFILCAQYCNAEGINTDTKNEIIALYNSNHLKEAYQMISTMTEEERDCEIWYILGNISQDLGNLDNSIFFFQKAIILDNKFDKAHYNLANIYLSQGKYNNAINEYNAAIKIKKDFPYYYYNLGCAYLGQKQYKDAKLNFLKAIKLKKEANFYYNLAVAYKNLNETEKADEAIKTYNEMQNKEDK